MLDYFEKKEGGSDRIEEAVIRWIITSVIKGVDYIHRNHIIHRDLKTSNILIDDLGYVKIIDFGLSEQHFEGMTNLTQLCGTPEYMAPETLKGNYDSRVDWWAVGIMMYEMACGYTPFANRGNKIL